MSYKLFNSEDTINFENIIIGTPVTINNVSKYYLYYLDEKPKEIYIKTPSIRLIYSYKNNKYNQIKLPIYPIWNKNKNFIKMIKTIEKFIKKEININKIFISCLEKKENITTLKVDFINDSSLLHDIKNYKVNGEIEGKISIPYVWENNEKYGLTILIHQLNYISNIQINNISVYENEDTNEQSKVIIPDQINYKKIEKPCLMISSNILKEALCKLKKI